MPSKNGIRKSNNNSPAVIDFGNRKISNQNFSKMVALPKDALRNCGNGKAMSVNVKLVHDKGEKFLKLTPVCTPKEASA